MFLSSASAEQWRNAVDAVLRGGVQRELEIEIVRELEEPRWYTARLAPIDTEGGGAPTTTHERPSGPATGWRVVPAETNT